MTLQSKILGHDGETLAAQYLKQHGYRILEQNFRNALGEIDIIAQEKDTICFIEVKTRRGAEYGSPLEAVSRKKQFKLGQLALSYLKFRQKLDAKARFDVITVMQEKEQGPVLELIKDAFDLSA